MVTIDLDYAETVEPIALDITIDRGTVPVPTPPGTATVIDIRAVDMEANVYASFPTAQLQRVTWHRKRWTEAVFTIPIDAPGIAELPIANENTTPEREVEIRRNGHILMRGPVITRRANSRGRVWTYVARDPLWYLSRRFIGRAERHNFLRNGSFEDGFNHWTEVGTITDTIDTADYVRHGESAQFVATTGANYKYQQIVMTAGPLGLAVFATVWYKITAFTAPAPYGIGARFIVLGATGPGSSAVAAITEDTERNKWQRAEMVVHIPPNSTKVLQLELWAINGTIKWDACTVTIEQSLACVPENAPDGDGWDQIQIGHLLVRYLAGKGPAPDPTKSNLHLAVRGDLSGVIKERVWQHFDHWPGYAGGRGRGALDEFLQASDGFDIRMAYGTHGRRVEFSYPSAGVERDDLAFWWTAHGSRGIAGWDIGESIEKSANQIAILGGWGSGAGREEGGYSNMTSLGGLTLERVESAPHGATVDALDHLAEARGHELERAIVTPVITLEEPRFDHPRWLVYRQEVLADMPEGWWRFNEPSGGTLADWSGNGRDGSYGGTVGYGTGGLVARTNDAAVTFDGATTHATVDDDDAWSIGTTGEMSWTFIIRPADVDGLHFVWNKVGAGSTQEWGFRIVNGTMQARITQADGTDHAIVTSPAGSIVAGETYHVGASYNGSRFALYINGEFVGEDTNLVGSLTNTSSVMQFGRRIDGVQWYAGVLDDCAIFASALSAERFAAHYQAMAGIRIAPTGEVRTPLIGALLPGDVLTRFVIEDGDVNLAGPLEIAQVTYLPANEQLQIVPNEPTA